MIKAASFFYILKKEKRFLFFLFLFSFVLKIIFFHYFLSKNKNYWVPQDSAQYQEVAVQIALGNGISNSQGDSNFYRVPGYSIFLAIFYKLLGFNDKIVLIVQIFLSSFIPVFVFFLSLIFFPTNIFLAKISSFFMTLSLGEVLHACLFMSESIFILFLLLFLVLFFSCFSLFFCKSKFNFSYRKIFFAGIFLGILSLIRPVGHFLLIVSMFLLFLSKSTFLKKLKNNFVFFLGWFLIVSFWLVRNFLLTGNVFFHAMPNYHFLTYFAAEIDSQENKCFYFESKNKLLKKWNNFVSKRESELNHKINDLEKDKLAQKLVINTLIKNPILTAKHALVNILKTLLSLNCAYLLFLDSRVLPDYSSNTGLVEKIKRFLLPKVKHKFLIPLIYLEIIFLLFILFGFFCAIIISFFNKNLFCEILKCLPFIILLLLLTFGSGVARLRLPVEPFFIIFSCDFWIKFFRKIRMVF